MLQGSAESPRWQMIEAQGWSLNPGRYVGVGARAADEFDFAERLEVAERGAADPQFRGAGIGGVKIARQRTRAAGGGEVTGGLQWREVKIGALGRVVTGKTPPIARPELFGEEHPFITPTDIDGVSREVTTGRFISDEGAAAFRNQMIPAGAVCFVCIGATIGKMCVAARRSLTNQQVNSIIVDEGVHDARFVFYVLRQLAPDVKGLAGGAATPIISKSSFSDIGVKVPTLEYQRRIASILSAYDDLIENNTRRIAILEEMARRIYEEWFVRFRFPGHEGVRMVESELGLGAGGVARCTGIDSDGDQPDHEGAKGRTQAVPRHELFVRWLDAHRQPWRARRKQRLEVSQWRHIVRRGSRRAWRTAKPGSSSSCRTTQPRPSARPSSSCCGREPSLRSSSTSLPDQTGSATTRSRACRAPLVGSGCAKRASTPS